MKHILTKYQKHLINNMKKETNKKLTITDVFQPINDYLVVEEVKEETNSNIVIVSDLNSPKNESLDNVVYKVLAIGPNVTAGIGVKVDDLILMPGMSRIPIVNFISDEHLLIRAHMVIGIVSPNYKEAKREKKLTLGTELLKVKQELFPSKTIVN